MPSDCIYDCRHPLWGGNGVCKDSTGTPQCICDDGFVTRDSMGNPSCVPQRVLVACYALFSATGAMSSFFLFSQARRQRQMPPAVQATRRAVVKMRLIAASSIITIATAYLFGAAAHRKGFVSLWDPELYVLQTYYTVCMSAICFTAAMVLELWVYSLPLQLLPLTSLAVKLRDLAERRSACVYLGSANAAATTAMSATSYFYNPYMAMLVVNMLTFVGLNSTGAGIIYVVRQTMGVINRATAQLSVDTPSRFYTQAKRSMCIQAAMLTFPIWLYNATLCVFYLVPAGRGTPIIPIAFIVMTAMLGQNAVIFVTKVGRDRPVSSHVVDSIIAGTTRRVSANGAGYHFRFSRTSLSRTSFPPQLGPLREQHGKQKQAPGRSSRTASRSTTVTASTVQLVPADGGGHAMDGRKSGGRVLPVDPPL